MILDLRQKCFFHDNICQLKLPPFKRDNELEKRNNNFLFSFLTMSGNVMPAQHVLSKP